MAALRHREEVLNTVLAQVIVARGMNASPETIHRGGKQRPDVIISFRGLRCVIEGKIGDVSDAKGIVLSEARERIDTGIAQVGVGVVYPEDLRSTAFAHLADAITTSSLSFCLLTEHDETNWEIGTVDSVLSELRRVHELLSSDDVVRQAAEELSGRLTEVAAVLMENTAVCERLSDLLGIGKESKESDENAE